MIPGPHWSTEGLITAFVVAAAFIALGGTRMAGLADRLADRTGMGEAMMGALFLGVSTSLPGITASVTAAVDGHATLAISNAMGGIAVQTAFLAVADVFHRQANLEHAAASATNLIHATLLILLLSIVALALVSPVRWTVGHVDVATPIVVLAYVIGVRAAYRTVDEPMWHPRRTTQTVEDRPDPADRGRSLAVLWIGFAATASVVMVSGMVVGRSAGLLVSRTSLSESLVGGLFMAIATSLPELVTTIAAVRRKALTLAVSNIAGGNAFDVLFVCVADVAYLDGSIYGGRGPEPGFLVGLAILLNTLLLLGLLRRERHGPANIGFESVVILLAYVAGFCLLVLGH
jgi:cation:H+ antiporter